MSPSRRIAGFVCRLVLVYAVLAVPWPGIRAVYTALYCAGGNALFGRSIPGGSVYFHPLLPATASHDTHIHFVNLRTGATVNLTTDCRRPAYLPTAFLVSLVLAAPIPWRRRLWALLWGMILLNVFLACYQLVFVLHAFIPPRLSLFVPSPPWATVLEEVHKAAEGDVVTWFIVPALIWVLVTLRREDLFLSRAREAQSLHTPS